MLIKRRTVSSIVSKMWRFCLSPRQATESSAHNYLVGAADLSRVMKSASHGIESGTFFEQKPQQAGRNPEHELGRRDTAPPSSNQSTSESITLIFESNASPAAWQLSHGSFVMGALGGSIEDDRPDLPRLIPRLRLHHSLQRAQQLYLQGSDAPASCQA